MVQLAAASDGVNRYDCSPSSGGSASTDTCVVVQMSTGGENEAECEEGVSGTAPDASCSITQQSTTGDNEAFAAQWWFQSAGNAQTAAQTVTLTQQSTTGSNEAFVAQLIDQQMRNGAPTQDQEGVQVACVQQDAQSGNDSAAVFQNMLQGEQEQAANTSQTQNQTAGPDTACGSSSTTISPNLAALVLQNENTPTASGSDNERVQQFLGQRELSFPTSGAASQLQGNNADIGGLEAIPNQNSSGVATANTSQAETQFQDAETATRTQTQNDPIHNPPNEGVQGTNPNDTFNLVQRSTQRADSGATQFYDMQGDCVSSGTCNVTQSFSTNTASNTMTCNQSACAVIQSNVGG